LLIKQLPESKLNLKQEFNELVGIT